MGRARNWWTGLLMVSPSILLVIVFVYGLIGQNIATSLSASRTRSGRVLAEGGVANYVELLTWDRYQHALWNLLVLTVVFVAGTMFFGMLWALLLEKGVRGEGFFRSVYLFPMAVSFIASGVVWRWLLDPGMDNQAIGLNKLFVLLGVPGLQSRTLTWPPPP